MKFEQALLGKIFLIIFACIFIQVLYKCIITPPSEGDSVDYHIPIARSYESGKIFDPPKINAVKHTRFYPANSEAILSLLYTSGLPLGLFNAFGIFTLFLLCIRLGLVFKLNIHVSIIFAVTVCTLNVVLRWADTQIADIWLLNFFLLALMLLQKPKRTSIYFLKLGLAFGLLIGTKYSAPFIGVVLFSFYIKNIWAYINLKRLLIFVLPIVILGLSWYLRNIYFTGNPLYPQAFLIFKGGQSAILNVTVAKVIAGSLDGLIHTVNSYISEFLVWAFLIPIVITSLFRSKSIRKLRLPIKLIPLSMVLILFFINLPSANQTHIMTSSFRYFLSAIIPLMLFTFVYFEKIGKIELLSVIALASLVLVEFPLGYYPKLFILTVPVAVFLYTWGYDFICRNVQTKLV